MQKFEFILLNEKKKFYNRFALLLFVLSAIAVIIRQINTAQDTSNSFSLFLSAAAILLIIYQTVIVYSNNVSGYIKTFVGASFALSLYWFYLNPWWIGILCLLLTLFYAIAQRELKIEVTGKNIIYPSFPKKKIAWDELNNLVLKDGLLTIDFKNDKIIQQYPDQKMNLFNEKEFNEFCRQQLRKKDQQKGGPGIGEALEGLGEIISSGI